MAEAYRIDASSGALTTVADDPLISPAATVQNAPPAQGAATASSAPPPERAPAVQRAAVKQPEPASRHEPEPVIVHVTLNTEDAGTHFINSSGDGDLLVTRALLEKIGLTHLPIEQQEDQPISLKSLAEWITFKLDEQSGELALMADPSLLPATQKNLTLRQPSTAQLIQDNAMFLNYHVGYQKSAASKAVISAPFELGMNISGLSVVNNFSYRQHGRLLRTQTMMVYDDRDNLRRWSAGDVNASSGDGIGGATIGGINLRKNYGLRPDLFTSPPLQLSTMLSTPSEVEVLIDGQSIYKSDFPAGPLNLANIPYYRSGSGNAELIVRDAFGREQRYSQSIYTSSALLAPGLSAYSYSLGAEQRRQSSGKIKYGNKPLLFASHRYGVTDWFTPGFGLESDGRRIRGGLLGSILLGNYGQLDMVTAGSRRSGVRGGLLHLNYNYTGTGIFSPNLSFTSQSPGYGGILDPITPAAAGSRWRASAGLAVSLSSWGSVSGRWSRQLGFNHQRSQSGSLLLSTHLPAGISLTAQLTRNWTSTAAPDNQTNLTLSRYFSNGLFLNASFSRSNRQNSFGIQLQYSPPLGDGIGYSASATSQPNGRPTTSTQIQYRNQYAEFSGGRSGTAGNGSYDLQLSSALLLAGGSLHVSRPVRDGYALVKVRGMDHVKVSAHNQEIGETDSNGELVVPYLNAYSDNRISIDPAAIPLGYKIQSTSKNVTSSYRGGGIVAFDVVKMQTVEAKAYYRINGKLESAQYSGLELMDGKAKKASIIGDGGQLYLENIHAGTYAARLFNQNRSCRFMLVIPNSDKIINDLGDVICDMKQASGKP